MTKDDLVKRLEIMKGQQQQHLMLFHQTSGALFALEELIKEWDKPETNLDPKVVKIGEVEAG